jgi:polyribonucleotide nucleotidyltransferase
LNVGDVVKVKLIGLDPRTGKFKLSRKALMPKPDAAPRPQVQPKQQEGSDNGEERL